MRSGTCQAGTRNRALLRALGMTTSSDLRDAYRTQGRGFLRVSVSDLRDVVSHQLYGTLRELLAVWKNVTSQMVPLRSVLKVVQLARAACRSAEQRRAREQPENVELVRARIGVHVYEVEVLRKEGTFWLVRAIPARSNPVQGPLFMRWILQRDLLAEREECGLVWV